MDCNSISLANIVRDCETSKGGIRNIYITNWAEGLFSKTGSTAGAVFDTLASGATWYKYELRKNTGSMTSTLNVDETNGVNYVSTELALVFNKMDTAKRLQMASLAIGQIAALVEDCNGKVWALGAEEPMAATAGAGQTGTAKTDGNNYSITLTDDQNEFPKEFVGTLPTPAA